MCSPASSPATLSSRMSLLLLLLMLLLSLVTVGKAQVTNLLSNETYPHRIADFGPRLDQTGVTGTLVAYDSLYSGDEW